GPCLFEIGVLFSTNLCLFLKKGSDYKSKPNFLTYTLYEIVSLIPGYLFRRFSQAISIPSLNKLL
ncbi:hypothetical protein, partial [Chryseobacterium potabilaquae]|uniref:hypothetical protein n=1 Tax=Chryseobacterium potabilaquae TaxID=2675057 RepID=UPI001E42AF9E